MTFAFFAVIGKVTQGRVWRDMRLVSFWRKFLGIGALQADGPAVVERPVRRDWQLPEGDLVYAIGDIHGRFDLLLQLLEKILADRSAQWGVEQVHVVFLGDYVDRGFQSREVIEYLMAFEREGLTPVCLRGNHEDLMLRFIDDPMMAEVWLKVGGVTTLSSYGIDIHAPAIGGDILAASEAFSKALPADHRAFLESLQVSWRRGDYFFVHAGLRPGVPLEHQQSRDMTTIRQDFTLTNHDFGVCVVHGHTGVRKPEHNGNRIAVDTGAFATGVLTAAALQGGDVRFISTT